MIRAEVLLDSMNPDGQRLTTMVLEYPRMIHAEFMTHRVFSRNAASSRAIPFPKMLQRILEDTAVPVKWGAEQKGMQSGDELPEDKRRYVSDLWMQGRNSAIDTATRMYEAGLHKSICNRVIEPWMNIAVLVSSTKWFNFLKLRDHPDAEPTIDAVAKAVRAARNGSVPQRLKWGEWHIPYDPGDDWTFSERLAIATARCARLSYYNFDGTSDPKADLALHERLKGGSGGIGHWSPFEHCAEANPDVGPSESNFGSGWLQYRKTFYGEDGEE
jgi:hypothetical protein